MFGLEQTVEALGYAVHVEPLGKASCDFGDGRFFVQAEGKGLELLDQQFTCLVPVVGVLAVARLPGLPLDPLPDLTSTSVVNEDQQMLVYLLSQSALDLHTNGTRRQVGAAVHVCHKTALLSDGIQVVGAVLDGNRLVGGGGVPAQFFQEEAREVEILNRLSNVLGAEIHD